MPVRGLGIFTLILCVVLFFLKLPNINEEQQAEEESGERKEYKSSVFSYAHVWFGMLGIFFYLGIELGVPSMLPAYFKSNPELAAYGTATDFLPYYWGGMMVGRFVGAAILNKFKPRRILSICLCCGALCVATSFFLTGIAVCLVYYVDMLPVGKAAELAAGYGFLAELCCYVQRLSLVYRIGE